MVKDKEYWKEYNQKWKEKGYFQNNYLQRKGKVVKNVEPEKVVKSVVKNNSVVKNEVVKLEPVVKSVVKIEKENILQPKKLWKDYYSVKKPYCVNCLKKGITDDEYVFCSTKKQPVNIYQTNEWGKENRKKLIHVFNEIYKCVVYDWTIWQSQGKINNHERK